MRYNRSSIYSRRARPLKRMLSCFAACVYVRVFVCVFLRRPDGPKTNPLRAPHCVLTRSSLFFLWPRFCFSFQVTLSTIIESLSVHHDTLELGWERRIQPGLSCLSLFRGFILPTPLLIPHRVSWLSNSSNLVSCLPDV